MLFNFIWWCIFGVAAGLIARFLVPGRNPMGCFATLALGLIGSIIGGVAGSLLWKERPSGVEPLGIALSILGGLIVILVYRKLHFPPAPRKRRDETDLH